MSANVNEEYEGSEIRAIITGLPEEVDRKTEQYLMQYSPCGYRTHMVATRYQDGLKRVELLRYRSCD